MALNDYALRFVAARKHRVECNAHARKFSSLRGLSKFTWEAWVKVGAGATSASQRCYWESQTGTDATRFSAAPTRENGRSILRFELCRTDGGSPTSYTFVLPQEWDDRWHHIAFAANIGEREYNIFYDGVNVQRGTLANAGKSNKEGSKDKPFVIGGEISKHYKEDPEEEGDGVDTTNKYIPAHICIGHNYSSTAAYWDGKIDNIRIWTNAKTGSTFGKEMFDHVDDYATNDGLLEEWRFSEGAGTETIATKDSASKATLKTGSDKSDPKEMWIGRGKNTDFGNLLHDYDRPFIGDGRVDQTPPTEPTNLKVVGTPSTDSFRISWTPSEDDVYVQRYEVDVATDSNFTQTLSEFSSRNVGRATDLIVSGLTEGTAYYWRVRAVDSASNTSRWSSTSAFRSYTTNTTTRINYSPNPSFEEDTDRWSAFTATGRLPELVRTAYGDDEVRPVMALNGSEGAHYLRITNLTTGSPPNSGAAHLVPWTKKQPMFCSFYVRGTGTLKVVVIPRYRFNSVADLDTDTNDQRLYTATQSNGTTNLLLRDDGWTRVWFLTKPDPKWSMDAVEIRFIASGGTGLAYTIDLDAVLIEQGTTLGDYFDGDSTSSNDSFYWVTTPVTGEGAYIIQPKEANSFGYRHHSPSLANPADIRNEQPVSTRMARDRVAPSAPRTSTTDLGSALTVTERGFIARWAMPLLNYDDIIGYDLDVSLSANMDASTAIFLPGYNKRRLGNTLSHPVTSLKPNTTYYYRVRAFDEFLNFSAWSETKAVKTAVPVDTEPPQEVELLDPSAIDYGRFTANWKPSFDFFGIDHYVVSVALDAPNNKILEEIVPATSLSYEVDVSEWYEQAPAKVTYFYSVRAVDQAGNSSQGLTYNRELGEFDPATYRTVEVLLPNADAPINSGIELVSVAVVDANNPDMVLDDGPTYALSATRSLLVNLPLDALGSIVNAELILTREAAHSGTGSGALWFDGGAGSDLWAKLGKTNETAADTDLSIFLPRAIPRRYPSVTVTVTALVLPEDRKALLFDPATVTYNTVPAVETNPSFVVQGNWTGKTFNVDLSPLLTNGIRTYGVVITTDGPVTVIGASATAVGLRPLVSLATNPTDALHLLSTQVRTQPTVVRNLYPNPTFDSIETVVPIYNATFEQGSTIGWDLRLRQGSQATLEYRAVGADLIGGAGELRIAVNSSLANAAGDNCHVRLTHVGRFRVDPSYTYDARVKIATDNRELSALLGVVWFSSINADPANEISREYCPSWRAAAVNEWYQVDLTGLVPPANALYAKLFVVAQPLQDNQTGTLLVDDLMITVINETKPVGVVAENGAALDRVTAANSAFMPGPDVTDSVLRATFTGANQRIRLTTLVDDREPWLREGLRTAVVNLMENPSFESAYGINDATKYYGVGAATLSRTRLTAKSGSYAVLGSFSDRSSEGYLAFRTVPIGATGVPALVASFVAKGTGSYTATLRVKYADSTVPVVSAPVRFSVDSTEWTDGRIDVGLAVNSTRVLSYAELLIRADEALADWRAISRVWGNLSLNGERSPSEVRYATVTPKTSAIFLDDLQIELAVSATSVPRPYCDGSLRNDHCYWYGAQDRSISFRNAFVGALRMRTAHIDPALRCWTELHYNDENSTTATVAGFPVIMPPLVRWENNRVTNPSYSVDGTASLTGWTSKPTASATSVWTADASLPYGRLGPSDQRTAKVVITANTGSATPVAELQDTGSTFLVTSRQRVYAYAMGRTTNAALSPYLKLTFFRRDASNNEIEVGSFSDLAASVGTQKWQALALSAEVPASAQFCRVSLGIYSTTSGQNGTLNFSSVWAGTEPAEINEAWVALRTLPIAPLGDYVGNVALSEIDLVLESSTETSLVCDFDGAAIKYQSGDVTTFCGATLESDWTDAPYGSASELYGGEITNLTYYAGDRDDSSVMSTLIRPTGWVTYDQPDPVTVRYNRDRRFVETRVPAVVRWNELAYGSFAGLTGWITTNGSTLQRYVPGLNITGRFAGRWSIDPADAQPRLISTEIVAASPGQVWSASLEIEPIRIVRNPGDPLGARLLLKFYDRYGQRVLTEEARVPLTVDGTATTGEVSGIAPDDTVSVALELTYYTDDGVVSLRPGDELFVRQAMLYNGAAGRAYTDGSDRTGHVAWEGVPYASPSIFVLRPRDQYTVLTLPFDEDGVASAAKSVETVVVMPAPPAQAVRYLFDAAKIDPTPSFVQITLPYNGDDRAQALVKAMVRRSDRYERSEADVTIQRAERTVRITKAGLAANTDYLFEVTIDCPPGLLRGARTHIFVVKTANTPSVNTEKTDSTVAYGGFVLNGTNSTYYWVNRHDSFSLPPRRMQIEQLPRMDGAVEMQSYWDRKTITIEGGVWGETLSQLDANLKDLRAALARPKQELRIDTLANGKAFYNATCSAFTVSQTGGEALTGLTWSATFECADPFLYRGEDTTYSFTVNSATSALATDDVLANDQEFVITNNGTVYALPQITITAKQGNGSYTAVVYNDTTSDRVMPKELLTKGEYITFNSKTRTCEKQGGKVVDFTGSFIQLAPGDNKLRVSLSALSPQRHNLLLNPSADASFYLANDPAPNVYPMYEIDAQGAKVPNSGVQLTQERTQTYNGSPFAALVRCDGLSANQGVVLRTAKALSDRQNWKVNVARTFVASAAIRTDDVSRNWYLKECFIRVWFTDGKYQNYDASVAVPAQSGRVTTRWDVVTTKPFTASAGKIDYVELILRTPASETGSQINLPVSFYVDECKLVETTAGAENGAVEFDIQVTYRERFI